MKRAPAALAVAAITALLAGCGSSGSSSSGGGSGKASPALSAAAWKQKINTICASMTAKSATLANPKTAAQLSQFARKIVSYGDAEIAQIKAVTAPPQYATGQQQVVADLTTIFGWLQTLSRKNTPSSAFRSPSVRRATRDYVARSKSAGLSSCVLTTGS